MSGNIGNNDVIMPCKPEPGIMKWNDISSKKQRLSDMFRNMSSRDNIGPIHADLLMEVLCRLRPNVLMRFCCVSKGWYGLILFYCMPKIIPYCDRPIHGFGFRVFTSPNWSDAKIVRLRLGEEARLVRAREYQHGKKMEPIDSCNGLMLFRRNHGRKWFLLWSRTIKKLVHCPIPYKNSDYAALAVEHEFKAFKIVLLHKAQVGATPFLHVYSTSTGEWSQRNVQYNNHLLVDNVAASDLMYCGVYLHGRLFRISGARLLLWYIIEDDDNINDVICDCVKLPNADCLIGRLTNQLGCIGLCQGHLQYAQNDTISGLMKIWLFRVGTSEWILKHFISLHALAQHPQLIRLRTRYPVDELQARFKPLAFGPVSDAIIIWAPRRIFSYFCNSGNLVMPKLPEGVSSVLKCKPYDGWPLTPFFLPPSYCVSHFTAEDFEQRIAPFLPC